MLGFSLLYDTRNGTAPMTFRIGSCIATIQTPRGILASPGYPVGYPNDIQCKYNIFLPPMSKINITFSSFDIHCGDEVELWDGHLANSTKMASFCGNGSTIPPYLLTSQNHLIIRYKAVKVQLFPDR